jgi:hypothetical protein
LKYTNNENKINRKVNAKLKKEGKPTNTSLAPWPRAPSTVRRSGMLREHNVFNITFFFAARELQDAGNVFSLPFIITLYVFKH